MRYDSTMTDTTLETYGLSDDEEVLFRPTPNARFKPAKVRGISKSGAIELTDKSNGASRTILPSLVQKKIRGPKGGVAWVCLIDSK